MTPRVRVDPPTPNASETLERLAQEVSQLAFHVKETVTELREEEGAEHERNLEHARRGTGGGASVHEQ